MFSSYVNFMRILWTILHVLFDLSCLEWLKIDIFMVNSRKMFLLQIQVSWVPFNVLCLFNLIYNLCLLFRFCLLILALAFLFDYVIVLICPRCVYVCASSHVVSFILHTISFMNQPWHHSNACISFMHFSDRAIGERVRWAHRCRRNRARGWVRGWTRRNPRQAAKHDPLHLFNLMQFSYLTWVLHSMLCIAFFYLLVCIYLPLIIYPCPCHLLVNYYLIFLDA